RLSFSRSRRWRTGLCAIPDSSSSFPFAHLFVFVILPRAHPHPPQSQSVFPNSRNLRCKGPLRADGEILDRKTVWLEVWTIIVFPHFSSPNEVIASCSNFLDRFFVSVASGMPPSPLISPPPSPPLQRGGIIYSPAGDKT